MRTTTCIIPPQIQQYFNSCLLSTPTFEKNLRWADLTIKSILEKATRKYQKGSNKDNEIWELYTEYRIIYERQKAKKRTTKQRLKTLKKDPIRRMRELLCDLKEWSPRSAIREMCINTKGFERFDGEV